MDENVQNLSGIVVVEETDSFEYGEVIDQSGNRLTDELLKYKGQKVEILIRVVK